MERLTKNILDPMMLCPVLKTLDDKNAYCQSQHCDCDNCRLGKQLVKLAYYENLEEQLVNTYGECDGLLEITVKLLVKHEGTDIGKPYKTKLLTDEDVDKWEKYKDLEEQVFQATGADISSMFEKFMHDYNLQKEGKLLELPCKVGDRFWELNNVNNVPHIYPRLAHSIQHCVYVLERLGKTVFLIKAEAEKALAEMEK